jgi:hypothetical protein
MLHARTYVHVCVCTRMYIILCMYMTKGLESVCTVRTRYFVAVNLDAVTGWYARSKEGI